MEMYAYIDESGDEGIGGKGTKWLNSIIKIAPGGRIPRLYRRCHLYQMTNRSPGASVTVKMIIVYGIYIVNTSLSSP